MGELFRRQPFEFDVSGVRTPSQPSVGLPSPTLGGQPLGEPGRLAAPPPEAFTETRTGTTGPPGILALADFLAEFGRPGAGQRQQAARQQQLRSLIAEERQEAAQQQQLAQQQFQNQLRLEERDIAKKRLGLAITREERLKDQLDIQGLRINFEPQGVQVFDAAQFLKLQEAGQDTSGATSFIPFAAVDETNVEQAIAQALAPINPTQDEIIRIAPSILLAREKGSIEPVVTAMDDVFTARSALDRARILASIRAAEKEPTEDEVEVQAEMVVTGEAKLTEIPTPGKNRQKVLAEIKRSGSAIISREQRKVLNDFDSLEVFINEMEKAVDNIQQGKDVILNLDRLGRQKFSLSRAARTVSLETGRLTDPDIQRVEGAFPTTSIVAATEFFQRTGSLIGFDFPNLAKDRIVELRRILGEIKEREISKVGRKFSRNVSESTNGKKLVPKKKRRFRRNPDGSVEEIVGEQQ